MGKDRKSPQQKKQLEYTKDHFTHGFNSSRSFPKGWRRKKRRINREYRRKAEEVLAPAKTGIEGREVELIADDLTAARFQKSVTKQRLRKIGTVTLGEKVKDRLERRAEAVGRNVRRHHQHDCAAASAVETLGSLTGKELVAVVQRVDLLCRKRNADELKRVLKSKALVDRALYFLYRICAGSAYEINALRRNRELDKALEVWIRKVTRMLEGGDRAREEKLNQKKAARKR
jgi:predicted exporter